MVLNSKTIYPSARSYVLKLRSDAQPESNEICGRVENMVTGSQCEFTTGAELLACLVKDMTTNNEQIQEVNL